MGPVGDKEMKDIERRRVKKENVIMSCINNYSSWSILSPKLNGMGLPLKLASNPGIHFVWVP